MLAALAVTPSASAPRVKLLCSATATNTRRLASGARRYAARAAVPAAERWETRPAPAGAGGAVAPFFRRRVSRVTTGPHLINHPARHRSYAPDPPPRLRHPFSNA